MLEELMNIEITSAWRLEPWVEHVPFGMTGHSPRLPRIVAWHARLSLARKLTFVGVLTSTVSLVIAMTAVLAWDLSSARTRLVRDTSMLADVIGSNSTAAVAFGDAKAATDTLRALTVNESIVSAAIWAKDGDQLARFERVSRPTVNRKLPARAFDIEPASPVERVH